MIVHNVYRCLVHPQDQDNHPPCSAFRRSRALQRLARLAETLSPAAGPGAPAATTSLRALLDVGVPLLQVRAWAEEELRACPYYRTQPQVGLSPPRLTSLSLTGRDCRGRRLAL